MKKLLILSPFLASASVFAENVVISNSGEYASAVSDYTFAFQSAGDTLVADMDLTGDYGLNYIQGTGSASDSFYISTSKDHALISASSSNSLLRWGSDGSAYGSSKGTYNIGENVEVSAQQNILRNGVAVNVYGKMDNTGSLSMDAGSLVCVKSGGILSGPLNVWGNAARIVVESGGEAVAPGNAGLAGDNASVVVEGYFQSNSLQMSGAGVLFDVKKGGLAAIVGDVTIGNAGVALYVGGDFNVSGAIKALNGESLAIEFTDSAALLTVSDLELGQVDINGIWGERNLAIISMTADEIKGINWFHDGEELVFGQTYFLLEKSGGGYYFSAIPEPSAFAAVLGLAALALAARFGRR